MGRRFRFKHTWLFRNQMRYRILMAMTTWMIAVWMGGTANAVGQTNLRQPPSKRPPNVVLIVSDDQAWTDYGFMGHPKIQTPHLDQLARESALFRRGYVPTALCRPSLATLITGLYPHQHEITGNDPAGLGLDRQSPDYHKLRAELIKKMEVVPTLPRVLERAGYLSFQSGKWWEGSYSQGGFTDGMTEGFPKAGGRHGDAGLTIGRDGLRPISDFLDRAIAADQPFCLWYAPLLPHEPHQPPQRLLDKYEAMESARPLANYFAMCEWFDESCGALLKELRDRNLEQNTIVIYLADNGWLQSATTSNRGSFQPRSKQSPYEAGIRTPILIRWPQVIPAGERDELCSSIDIVPTVLGAVGEDPLPTLSGVNWIDHLRNGVPNSHRALFGESFAHDVVDLNDPEASLVYRWMIQEEWKLILTYDGAHSGIKNPPQDFRPQLYNLILDPTEQHNLASEHPQRVVEMAEALQVWWPVNQRRTATQWSDQPISRESLSPSQSELQKLK